MIKKIKWNGLSWEVLTFGEDRNMMRSCKSKETGSKLFGFFSLVCKLTNPGERHNYFSTKGESPCQKHTIHMRMLLMS